ncbi:MAG: hypothetical protein ABIJ65_09115 [Chloroflexota bacterium]
MHSELVPRFGTFLILVGIGLFLVFVTYELGGTRHFDIFIFSLIIIFIGTRLNFRGKSDSPNARFKTARKLKDKFKNNNDPDPE